MPWTTKLVGRAAELAELEGELTRASAGEFRCILLLADPGMGKTRLATELLHRNRRGSLGLSARAYPLGMTASLGLWAEALDRHLRGLPGEKVSALCDGVLEDLAGLLRSVAKLHGSTPTHGIPRFRVFEGLAALVKNLAREKPLLVVLDDVHHADGSSWEAIHFLTHNIPESRVLVVAGARAAELSERSDGSEVVLGLEQEGMLRRLTLEPLGQEGLQELTEAALGQPAPSPLTNWLADRSRGNPLFVLSLLQALLEEGADLEAPALRRLPEGLSERVANRSRALDAPSTATLEMLAVLGRPVGLIQLGDLLGSPLDALGKVLEGLVRSRLIVEEELDRQLTYEMAHPLIQEAVYQGIGGARRRALHRVAGKALLASAPAGEAAMHFARSAHVGDQEAIAVVQEAVRQAEARGEYGEALTSLSSLVQLLPLGDPTWLEVLGTPSFQLHWFASHRARTHLGVEALRSIDSGLEASPSDPIRATAKLRLAEFLLGVSADMADEADRALTEAIRLFERAGDRRGALLGAVQRAWVRAVAGDWEAAAATARTSAEAADAAGERLVAAEARDVWGAACSALGRFAEAEAVFRRAIAIAPEDGATSPVAFIQTMLAWSFGAEGRIPEALGLLDEAKILNPSWRESLTPACESVVRYLAGDYPGVVAGTSGMLPIHPGGLSKQQGPAFAVAAVAAAEGDRIGEARRFADIARSAYRDGDWLRLAGFAAWADAMVFWREGEPVHALEILTDLGSKMMAEAWTPWTAFAVADAVEIAAECGEAATASAACLVLDEIERRVDRDLYRGLAALGAAQVAFVYGDDSAAGARAGEAAKLLRPLGYRALYGRALDLLGRSLISTDRERAMKVYGQAVEVFEACEAVWRANRARKVLGLPESPRRLAAAASRAPARLQPAKGAGPLEFRILGHLEVCAGGRPLDLGGHRQRAVLALLVLEANRVVSLDQLADRLWGGRPPPKASGTLHAYISNLRRALEPGRRPGTPGTVLVTQPPGYVLKAEPDQIDAARFERLVKEGQDALAAGDPENAQRLLGEALSLWRGPVLADVALETFAQAEGARLEELRAGADEDRLQAALDLGRHREVVADLEQRVAAEPLREGLRAKLMLALYRSGRQADALARYQDGRRILADELGIDPGPELKALEEAILLQKPELAWCPLRATEGRTPTSSEALDHFVRRTRDGAVHDRPIAAPLKRLAAAVPMPTLLTDVGGIFVGRERELERLRRLWDGAASGNRRVVLVAGEPGVGKTRLAAELAQAAHAEGAVVLAGRCDEDLGVPYQPFVEALRHFADHIPSEDLAGQLGRYGGELTRLVPELADWVPRFPSPLRSDPETERYRLFDAVARWLGAVAAQTPVVLILDDLQWAAKPTLMLARHVLRSPHAMRLFVLGTYRDTELRQDHPLVELLADLRRQPGVERLSLAGLDQAAVVEFMAQAAGHEMADEGVALARAIHRETEGNPFFVRECLRHLTETGAIEQRQGRWTTRLSVEELGIPEGVRELVGRRLARLSDEANRALRVAAVMGSEFELPVIQAAERLDEEAVLLALEETIAARLVLEIPGAMPRHRFAHALVRDTLYEEVSAARRLTLHRRVAEAIEEMHAAHLDEHVPALAHHYAAAADTTKAVTYATRAGDRALAQLANDEAVTYYRQALDVLNGAGGAIEEARRIDLLVALGEAQRRAGDPAHRETLLDAAGRAQYHGDAMRLARAALHNYRGFWSISGAVDAERVAVLEAALRAVEASDSLVRVHLLANLAAELYCSDDARRRTLSDEALALGRRLGDPPTLAHVLLARCVAIWEPSTARERLASTAELLTLADRLDDPAIVAWNYVWRFMAATELADLDEADRSLDNLATLAADLGQPTLLWVATYGKAGRTLLAGRISEAERLTLEAGELGRSTGQPDARPVFGTQRFQIRFEQGRLAELVGRLTQVLEERGRPTTRALLALAYCELDQDEEARRVFEPLAVTLADIPVRFEWLQVMTTSAAVCAHLQDGAVAARLIDPLAPYADHLVGPAIVWWGSVSHYLGLLTATLGRLDEADARFAAAEATHSRIGAPTWLARTRLEWGRMLLNRRQPGDVERASELLGKALAAARELGLGNVERRAVTFLQELPVDTSGAR